MGDTHVSQNINNFLSISLSARRRNRVQLFESSCKLFSIFESEPKNFGDPEIGLSASPKFLDFLLSRNIGDKSTSSAITEIDLHENSSILERVIPPFSNEKSLPARGIFPHFFTIVTDTASTRLCEGRRREDYDAIPFKDGQAIRVLGKDPRNASGHRP